MTWKPHYRIRLSDMDRAIIEELAVAEYHALPTLRALFGRDGSAYLERRLVRLTERGFLMRIELNNPRDFGRYAYYLGKKGIDEARLGDGDCCRLMRILRRGSGRSPGRMTHDLYRAKLRTHLLLDPTLRLERWMQRRDAAVVGAIRVGEKSVEKCIEPDCLFSYGKGGEERVCFLEVDMASYPVERSSLDQGSSVYEKLLVYESVLSDRDLKTGRRWRLEHLGVPDSRILFFKPSTLSSNLQLASQRFRRVREVVVREELKALQKRVLFADDGWQSFGEPFRVEDHERNGLSL